MSLIKLRWINLHRLLFTPEKLLINRRISIKFVKKYEELILNKVVDGKEKFNDDKWLSIRKDLFASGLAINEANIDCLIIDRCWEGHKYELALSYVQYLIRTEKQKLNIGTIGRYFKLLFDSNKTLTPQEIQEIYQLYDEIIEKYPVIDALTAKNLISGLALTERWKECLKLLDMIETSSTSQSTSYSSIVSAAFDHDDFALGWKYLEKMYPRLEPLPSALNSFLNYCTRVSTSTRELEYVVYKLFHLWKDYDIKPPLDTVMIFVDTLTKTGQWSATKTTVNKKNGYCQSCKQKLKPFSIEEKDFKYLSDAVMSNTLVGDDVYDRTTPDELRKFKEFVNKTKPYDVCIDGLNVAYTLNRTKKNSNIGKELAEVVAEFMKQNKKVFVLGRKHMSRWSPEDMNFIKKNCYIFFAHNLSNDDPFLLYATLASGINTYFASRDLMRQHKYLLQDDVQQIFQHWQTSRQIFPTYVGTNFHRTLLLIYPPKYLPVAQEDPEGWHIPYSDEAVSEAKVSEINIPEPPKTWICLRKKS